MKERPYEDWEMIPADYLVPEIVEPYIAERVFELLEEKHGKQIQVRKWHRRLFAWLTRTRSYKMIDKWFDFQFEILGATSDPAARVSDYLAEKWASRIAQQIGIRRKVKIALRQSFQFYGGGFLHTVESQIR
jgi:hypothetical protein